MNKTSKQTLLGPSGCLDCGHFTKSMTEEMVISKSAHSLLEECSYSPKWLHAAMYICKKVSTQKVSAAAVCRNAPVCATQKLPVQLFLSAYPSTILPRNMALTACQHRPLVSGAEDVRPP
jgi:hypothetical protein